jgi:hypothetical protein
MSDITLLPYSTSHEQECADMIAALPDWFGIPEANVSLSSSHPDPNYAHTREFYFALGLSPLFESDTLWGPENPAVILIKTL